MAEIISIPASGGGVDWSKKTFQTSTPTGTHGGVTHLDITGSGYLVGIHDHNGFTWSIQVDGGSIYQLLGEAYGIGTNLFPIRFNTSLKVTNSNQAGRTDMNVWVVVD